MEQLKSGTPLASLVAAGALANARAFGGSDYNGYHALMALLPSFEMAAQMPSPYAALPVLKVLHRNARFVGEAGRATNDSLAPIEGEAGGAGAEDRGSRLADQVRRRETAPAEQSLAAAVAHSPAAACTELQQVIRDDLNVHRVVLAWRSFDLLRLAGDRHATTLLRQPLRFCINEDGARERRGQPAPEITTLLPRLLEEHHLDRQPATKRAADDAWIAELADTICNSDCATAAKATAAALAAGFDGEDVGAALSLAAVTLLLRDRGREKEEVGKPRGSIHGASVGVHASDAANAWRHLARVGDVKNACASLITSAYHTAGQSRQVGPQHFDHDAPPTTLSDPAALLTAIDGAVRERDQRTACSAARRWCEIGHPAAQLFAQLLAYAVSEDGALHFEKYFRTAQEEHALARPSQRAVQLVALTRVAASSFGFPAPGVSDARRLLAT